MQYNEQAIRKAKQAAQSPQGQQLFQMLQSNHSELLNQAMNQASQIDYGQVQQILQKLLQDPEARKLLSQLGGTHE